MVKDVESDQEQSDLGVCTVCICYFIMNKFLLFRVETFSEGTLCAGMQTGSLKMSPLFKWQKSYQVYQVLIKNI